ncbi:hypothetical protein RASY3_01525 [Ruminococcus albus SY3]|uniref:Uncharacterized protein n=1 Tax=Ruminococcus albus SY3 TaxID=1341156 RepID=A0A011W040_RUMAL|nr:hypothetical protein [Ruminococcus albus]EXM40946.1 hypothetical protein RASY3_01525 [Ruminococcus albus SY3]
MENKNIPPYKLAKMSEITKKIVTLLVGNTAFVTLDLDDCKMILHWAERMITEGTNGSNDT